MSSLCEPTHGKVSELLWLLTSHMLRALGSLRIIQYVNHGLLILTLEKNAFKSPLTDR